MSESLLDVRGISVRYGAATALDTVSIDVRAGETVALIGPNGAGKSSLLKAIMGLVRPAAGEITYGGRLLGRMPPWARARLGLGYSPEGRRVFPGMTVRENLTAAAQVAHAQVKSRVDEVYRLFPDLVPHDSRMAWQLSGGQQQMLAIGRALMSGPRLLLLDEPSLGLSPRLTRTLFARVRNIAGAGGAVLLADQNGVGAMEIADRGYVLDAGRVTAPADRATFPESFSPSSDFPRGA